MNRQAYAKNDKPQKFRPPLRYGQVWTNNEWMDFGVCEGQCDIYLDSRNPYTGKWECSVIGWQANVSKASRFSMMGKTITLSEQEIYKNFDLETTQRKGKPSYRSKVAVAEDQIEVDAAENYVVPDVHVAEQEIENVPRNNMARFTLGGRVHETPDDDIPF